MIQIFGKKFIPCFHGICIVKTRYEYYVWQQMGHFLKNMLNKPIAGNFIKASKSVQTQYFASLS
jgi:hypothetical protein